MGFWRKEVIEFALDDETRRHMAEQTEWIGREPANPQPYYNLAQLYRMQWKPEAALGLLLEAIRLDQGFADAHAALAEIYAVGQDYAAAWRHARAAAQLGNCAGVDLLTRHAVPE